MVRQYHSKNIRVLLTEGFTDRELRQLCFDVSKFRSVYDQLSEGTGKTEIVHQLLEYADRKELIEILLDEVKERNPNKYEIHKPYYQIENVSPLKMVATCKADSEIYTLSFSPSGDKLIVGTYSGVIEIRDIANLSESKPALLKAHDKPIHCVKFSPNGKWLASSSEDDTVRLWCWPNLDNCCVLQGHNGTVTSLAFSPDANLVVTGSRDSTLRIWSLPDGKLQHTLTSHDKSVYSVDWSLNGMWIASGSSDQTVKLWSANHCDKSPVTLGKTTGTVLKVAFSPDNTILASGDWGGYIRTWDISVQKSLHKIEAHNDRVLGLVFLTDGQLLVSSSKDKSIRCHKVLEGQTLFFASNHTGWIRGLAFSLAGNYLASGDTDRIIYLWQVFHYSAKAA